MKILVTGAAGFIGSQLVEALLQRGDEIIGLDNINDYYDLRVKYGRLKHAGISEQSIQYGAMISSLKHNRYKFIKLELEDKVGLSSLFEDEKFDAVCNLAAQAGVRYSIENPHTYVSSNILGFLNILECCRHSGVNNLCYASSSSVYGLNQSYPFDTSASVDHPMSLYAASKKTNELMAHTYSHLYGIATTGLRFFTVYGPWGRPDMALYLFTKAAFDGSPIDVYNNGQMLRDFTYIDDIVIGITKVIDKPARIDGDWDGCNPNPSSSSAPYKIYNIGNNSPVKLMDFIEAIETATDKKIVKNMLPLQPGDVPSTFANVDSLVADHDYKPCTSIQYGVTEFVRWYRNFFLNES